MNKKHSLVLVSALELLLATAPHSAATTTDDVSDSLYNKTIEDESLQDSLPKMKKYDQSKEIILHYLESNLSEDMYKRISSGYDSLVVKVDDFEQVAEPNNMRFRKYIEDFIEKGNVYYIIDNTDLSKRKLNMFLHITETPRPDSTTEIRFENMYIPIPQKN